MKMKQILLIFITVFCIFTFVSHIPIMSENRCKRYILVHKDRIETGKYNGLTISKTNFKYYTDITVRLLGTDSTYQIIFWGNRDSWKWRFKLDKHFVINIPYARYKNKYNVMDGQILELINSKSKPIPEIKKNDTPALKFV